MYSAQDGMPAPLTLDSLDALSVDGDINETPFHIAFEECCKSATQRSKTLAALLEAPAGPGGVWQ